MNIKGKWKGIETVLMMYNRLECHEYRVDIFEILRLSLRIAQEIFKNARINPIKNLINPTESRDILRKTGMKEINQRDSHFRIQSTEDELIK